MQSYLAMVVGNNKSTATKNAGESLAIWIVMAMQRCTARGALPDGAHPGLRSKPLDAAIGRLSAPYCPGGRHVRQIRMKPTKH